MHTSEPIIAVCNTTTCSLPETPPPPGTLPDLQYPRLPLPTPREQMRNHAKPNQTPSVPSAGARGTSPHRPFARRFCRNAGIWMPPASRGFDAGGVPAGLASPVVAIGGARRSRLAGRSRAVLEADPNPVAIRVMFTCAQGGGRPRPRITGINGMHFFAVWWASTGRLNPVWQSCIGICAPRGQRVPCLPGIKKIRFVLFGRHLQDI
jgi:hypothetical protein